MKYNEWMLSVVAEINSRYGATVTPSGLESALQDEPKDMYEDGESPSNYVDMAYGEYGPEFWIPVEL